MSQSGLGRAVCVWPFIACGSIDPPISWDLATSHVQFAACWQIYFGFAISHLSVQNQVISGHLPSRNGNPLQLVWQTGDSTESSLGRPLGEWPGEGGPRPGEMQSSRTFHLFLCRGCFLHDPLVLQTGFSVHRVPCGFQVYCTQFNSQSKTTMVTVALRPWDPR